MLIEFKVSNYRSIREPQTFTMVAGTHTKDGLPQNIIQADFDANLQLVRSAAIYGPNASGKTNLIRALWIMSEIVLSSAKESQYGEKIPVESFLFDKQKSKLPSEFEITFSIDSIRYQYGFIVDENRIFEEWLLVYPHGRPQKWFIRKYNKQNENYDWEFSNYFKGSKKPLTDATRDNSLFLSTAVLLNNDQLKLIYNWFQNDLIIIPSLGGLNYEQSILQIETDEGKKQIIKYLNIADPSVADVLLNIEKFNKDKLPPDMPNEFKKLAKKLIGENIKTIHFLHNGNISLALRDESHGTQNFLAFAGHWIDALTNGRVLIVDELNNGLHPLLVRFLIELFSDLRNNQKNAQLIFSTHDATLLDNELFRRDQIWFVEKDKTNSTQIYPLLDFSPRKQESIGKGYLQGRYGALPYVDIWGF